jgi:FSR family fosmidomycin resistance protein-like MFS transporter
VTVPEGGLGAETEALLEMEARGSTLVRPHASDRNLRLLVAASLVHFLNDFYIAFLAPLLPLVVTRFHLSLTLAGLLATILNTSAAMSQPLFGALADRMPRRVFVVVGPLLSATGMGLMGLAPSYGVLIVLLFIAGTGTAAFHPQGAATAGQASGRRKGAGLSLFVAGGELGYALGPLVIAVVVAARGLDATWTVALPGIMASLLLARSFPRVRDLPSRARARSLHADLAGVLRPLIILWFFVVLRSVVITSYQTFIPLLLTQRGGSLVAGGAAAFLFGGIGAIGGISGGMFSDRIGRRRMLALSLILSAPLLFAFIRGHGASTYVFLAAGGIAVYLSAAVTIVMAQELLPHRAGVASSIVMGLAWGTAGLALTGVGALADAVGLANALGLLLLLFVPALGAVLMLPKTLDTAAEQPQ